MLIYKDEKKYYLKSFLIAAITAAVMLLPFVIAGRGIFLYFSDYNYIELPYYQHCVDAVRSGFTRWDWQTDLGANFVGTYTYYRLGNPFFWIMTLFPSSFTLYLVWPFLCVEYGLMSLFAFAYIRRFTEKPQSALIGGIVYAFSSFSLCCMVWQFQDAILWFPLLLIGLEEAVVNKNRGVFALTVAVNCLSNYYFFIQEVIFVVIYFCCRIAADKKFRMSIGNFLLLAFESVLGVMIACVLFMPSIYAVLGVPRVSNILSEWDFMFYKNSRVYGIFLESLFFPGEVILHSYMFTTSFTSWTAAAAYLPLFSIAGVVTYVKSAQKGHWARYLLPICLLIYFVPGLNAMFTMLNTSINARWLFMPLLICSMATACALEHKEYDWDFGYRVCEFGVCALVLLSTCTPFEQTLVDENGVDRSFYLPRFLVGRVGIPTLRPMNDRLLINIGLALVFLLILKRVLKSREKFGNEVFMKRLTAVTAACSLALGYYYIGIAKSVDLSISKTRDYINKGFEIDDDEFYRMEIDTMIYNSNMFWNESSFECSQNIVPGPLFELYNAMGIERELYSGLSPNFYAFRALTNTKYMQKKTFSEESEKSYFVDNGFFRYLKTEGDNEIYISDYALPMGFAYDNCFPIDDVPKGCRIDNLMTGTVLLTREQIGKYSDILETSDLSYAESLIPETYEDEERIFDVFVSDNARRAELGVTDFKISREGFTAKCDYDRERLVMFSVPYCDGWTATVNGSPVEVEKVNIAFCAVKVPAGECEISFEYFAPGMKTGIILTASGIVIFVGYMLIVMLVRRKRDKKQTVETTEAIETTETTEAVDEQQDLSEESSEHEKPSDSEENSDDK